MCLFVCVGVSNYICADLYVFMFVSMYMGFSVYMYEVSMQRHTHEKELAWFALVTARVMLRHYRNSSCLSWFPDWILTGRLERIMYSS